MVTSPTTSAQHFIHIILILTFKAYCSLSPYYTSNRSVQPGPTGLFTIHYRVVYLQVQSDFSFPNACGTNACGSNACGIDACGTDACGTDACGTDACGTDACGTNVCGSNACLND